MREKVANMMKLLEERKNKLKQSENVLDKRGNLVDKVNKVLDSKLRKADFVQKQRDESLAFNIQHKIQTSTEKEPSNEIELNNTEKSGDQEVANVEDVQSPQKSSEKDPEITKVEDEQSPKESDEECQLNNNTTTNEQIVVAETENKNFPTLETETTKESSDSQL